MLFISVAVSAIFDQSKMNKLNGKIARAIQKMHLCAATASALSSKFKDTIISVLNQVYHEPSSRSM